MKLTIPIPVHNTKPEHLFEAYYSIVRQDDGNNHRIIIVDDCSNNEETLYALEALSKLTEVIRTPEKLFLSGLLNWVHNQVDCEFMARMDSDDISHPSRLRNQIAYMKSNPDTDIVGTNLYSFLDSDFERKPRFTTSHPETPGPNTTDHDKKKNHWLVNHATIVYRKEAIESIGGYDPTLERKQDVELWERMWKSGDYKFRNVEAILYAWRRYQ